MILATQFSAHSGAETVRLRIAPFWADNGRRPEQFTSVHNPGEHDGRASRLSRATGQILVYFRKLGSFAAG